MTQINTSSILDGKHNNSIENLDGDELRRRGWFDSTTQKLLPIPDLYIPNAQDPLISPALEYSSGRVFEIEKDRKFAKLQNEILDAAAKNILDIGSNHWKLFQIAHQIPLDCTCLEIEELEARVTEEVLLRFAGKQALEIKMEDRQIFATQILMRDFEPQLWKLEPYFFNPAYQRAREIVMDRLLRTIAENYPQLEDACQIVAMQNDFMLFPSAFYENE